MLRTACGYFVFLEWVRKCTRAVITLFFLLVTFFYASGQGYLVHRYSERDGLPGSEVHDVTQDHWGRMWFATRVGIAVYDGVSWENYAIKDGLPQKPYFRIRVDRAGRIWALADAGDFGIYVAYYHENSEINGIPKQNKQNREKEQKKAKKSWNQVESVKGPFKFTSFQLLELKQKQADIDRPIIAVGTAKHGIFLWNRGEWKNITEKDGLLSSRVNGLAVLDGTLYAATANGLSIINLDRDGSFSIDNRVNRLAGLSSGTGPGDQGLNIMAICVESKDRYTDSQLQYSRLWLFTQHWLGYFQENRFKMTIYPLALPFVSRDRPITRLPDYRSGLYIGEKFELLYFNYITRSWERLGEHNGLSAGGANSLFIDFEKNIWAASDRGVSKIVSRRFSNFQEKDGLLDDEVTAVLEYEPGKFVLGHKYGLTFYNGKEFQQMAFPEKITRIPICRVLDMKSDSKKNLWLALSQAGLAKVNLQHQRETRITWYGQGDGLPASIMCLWVDRHDKLWVGTGQGIFSPTHYQNGSGNRLVFKRVKEFPTIYLRRMAGFSGQLRYVGSMVSGFWVVSQQKQTNTREWKHYRVPGDRNANTIYAIKKDSSGRLLIGTARGLYTLGNETPRQFSANGFQVDRPVYFILEDTKKRLWFGTDKGVVRWDGKQRKEYAVTEGLVGHETNRAAGLVDSRGRIWIGTNNGVSVYDEAFDNNKFFNPPPKIHLMHLEASGKRIPLSAEPNQYQPIRLSDRENNLVFHFRGISFSDETAIRFSSKLAGLEEEWSDEHYPHDQMIRFPNLLPGQYRFHIKVRNAQGVWSKEVTSPEIIIFKPFYKKWWFYVVIVLTLGGVFYTILLVILGKRQAALLEKEVENRTHQLQAVEKQYQDLFEESKDVVLITTPDGRFIDINPAGVDLFRYDSKEELLNTPVIDIYKYPEDRDKFQTTIETGGYVKDYEQEFIGKGGEPITALVTATSVRDRTGKIVSYRGIIRDITDRKTLEQRLFQAQKMEAIGTLAGGIAHDFNNILGVILGYTELLLEDLPEGSQEHLNTRQILTAAERAKELVKQILAFSRQSKGERKPVKLGTAINEAVKLLRSTLPSTIEIRLDIRVDPGADMVLADVTRLHQVMMNLGANAAHAMQTNGGVMDVILDEVYLDSGDVVGHKELKPGPYLRLTVSDTGHGISPEVMERIFDPFFTTKTPGEGTGMGLAVIHGIVKDHGGDITAYSKPGKGSSFHVYLPRLEEEAELKPTLTEEIPGGSERILLVDDESALTQVGKQILERLGYEVEGKANSMEALEVFRNEPDRFHLIISDVTMPQMTGIQLAIEAKRIRPRVPFILCSGFSTAVTKEEIKSIGVNDFVMKPIIKGELARVVRRVLDESKE